MRLSILTLGLLLATGPGGCMWTHHVERHSTCTTVFDTGTGSLSSSQQTVQDERHWHGPWFAQPDSIRP